MTKMFFSLLKTKFEYEITLHDGRLIAERETVKKAIKAGAPFSKDILMEHLDAGESLPGDWDIAVDSIIVPDTSTIVVSQEIKWDERQRMLWGEGLCPCCGSNEVESVIVSRENNNIIMLVKCPSVVCGISWLEVATVNKLEVRPDENSVSASQGERCGDQ